MFFHVVILLPCLPRHVQSLSALIAEGSYVATRASGHLEREHGLRMAICMSGPARTIIHEDVYKAFDAHVRGIDFAQGLFGKSPDLYMYLRTGDSINPDPKKKKSSNPVDGRILNNVVRALRPISVKIVAGSGPYEVSDRRQLNDFLHNSQCFSTDFFEEPRNVGRNMNMFEGYRTCHAMMEAKEAHGRAKYDVVMFTRPDLLWQAPIPKEMVFADKAVMASDWWHIVPRSMSNSIASILLDVFLKEDTYINTCCECGRPEDVMRCAQRNIGVLHNMSGPHFVPEGTIRDKAVKGVVDAPKNSIVVVGRTCMDEVIKRSDGTVFDKLIYPPRE